MDRLLARSPEKRNGSKWADVCVDESPRERLRGKNEPRQPGRNDFVGEDRTRVI